MASSDDAATDQFRDFTDAKVAFVAGVYTIALTLSLKYDVGTEVSFVYRLLLPAPYFAYVFSRDTALSVRTRMTLIAVVTLGTFGFFAF